MILKRVIKQLVDELTDIDDVRKVLNFIVELERGKEWIAKPQLMDFVGKDYLEKLEEMERRVK